MQLIQFGFFMFLFFLGLLTIINIRTGKIPTFFFLSSFPVGIAIWAMGILFLGVFQIPIRWFTVLPLFSLYVVALFIRAINLNKFMFNKNEKIGFLITFTIHAAIFLFFSSYIYNFATPDSFEYIRAGKAFAMLDWNAGARNYIAFGPLLPFLETASVLLGLDYLYGLIPTTMGLFLVTIIPLFYTGFKLVFTGNNDTFKIQFFSYKINITISALLSLLSVVILASNWFFQLFAFFIHSNPLAMIYMTFAFLATWIALEKGDKSWLVLSAIAGFALSISRVETFFIALLPLIFVIDEKRFSHKVVRQVFLPGNTLILLWSARKFIEGIGEQGSYINQTYNFGIVLISLGAVLLIIFHPLLYKRKLRLPRILLIGLSFMLIVFFTLQPAFMLNSIKNLYYNLFNTSTWDYIWYFTLPFFVFCLITPKRKNEGIFRDGIIIYVLLVLAFAFLRGGGYHARWSDSGNRMIFHILPLTLFYTISKIITLDSNTQ